MSEENYLGTERPKCQNPNCENGAQVVVESKMLCGACTMKIMTKRAKEKEEKLMRELAE